jgi:hypothetical protein
MASDYLLDYNRLHLRKIFQLHAQPQNPPTISYPELVKLCSNLRIFPDLLTSVELKRIVIKVTSKHFTFDSKVHLTYLQFEKFLRAVSEYCFTTNNSESERLKLLFIHIRGSCQLHYNVNINVRAEDSRPLRTSISSIETRLTLASASPTQSARNPGDISVRTNHGIPFKPLSGSSSASIKALNFRRDKATSVNRKVKQLYAMISPRNVSLSLRESLGYVNDSTSAASKLSTSRRAETEREKSDTLERIKDLFQHFQETSNRITSTPISSTKTEGICRAILASERVKERRMLLRQSLKVWYMSCFYK